MFYTQATGFSYFGFRQDERFKVVTQTSDLEVMMNCLRQAKSVAFDYETDGLAWWKGKRPCGVAFTAHNKGDPHPLNWYVPFRHRTGQNQLSPEVVIGAQKEILEHYEIEKIAHNLKFETHMSRVDGIKLRGPRVDTMIEARLWNEDAPGGLKDRLEMDLNDPEGKRREGMLNEDINRLASRRGLGVKAYKDLIGYAELDIYLCGGYAGYDTLGAWNLHQFYEESGVRRYYSKSPRQVEGALGIYDVEMRLVSVLARMEEIGQPIDSEYLQKLHQHLLEQQEEARKAFFKWAYPIHEFNLSSDDQLREFLSKYLKCTWREDQLTKTKQPAVDYDTISEFAEQYPGLNHVLRYKECEKKLSTYTLALIELADENGVIHCNYRQEGTNTGRMSCKDPNLQNVSSDDSDRAKANGGLDPESIKRAFVVRRQPNDPFMQLMISAFGPDVVVVRQLWDYSQVELRVLTEYTQDPGLMKAYDDDKDIHDEVEKAVFGTCITYDANGKKIDGPNRRKAKVINFGLSYCMSPIGFVRQIKEVTPEEAEGYFNEYNRKFPGVPAFREMFWKYIRMNKCQFDSKFGRTRHIPSIVADNQKDRKRAERMAIATLIQGTAAEFTKQSLVLLDEAFEKAGLVTRLSQTIHDEIQTDGPAQEFAEVARITKRIMTDFPDFRVPIKVDGSFSTTHWADKKGIPGLK